MLGWLLPCISIYQLWVYTCPFPPEPPSHLPPHLSPLVRHKAPACAVWCLYVPAAYSEFPLASCCTHGNVCLRAPSQLVPPSPSPLCPLVCSPCLRLHCGPAYRIINTVCLDSLTCSYPYFLLIAFLLPSKNTASMRAKFSSVLHTDISQTLEIEPGS